MNIKEHKIQIQYSMVQFLYWVCSCLACGFAANFLQYKGLSNTMVGLVVGAYNVLTLAIQPLSAKIVTMIHKLTVKKMMAYILVIVAVLFVLISALPMSISGVLIIFVLVNAINNAFIPLLNAFGMEYINQNRKLSFGLARGIGSMGWAVTSAVVGVLLERFSPDILGYMYLIVAVIMLILLGTMEDLGLAVKATAKFENEKKRGLLKVILSNPVIRMIGIGTLLLTSSHAITTVFTINLVRHAGGSDSMMGIAQFIAAGSEIIGMLLFTYLHKKIGTVNTMKLAAIIYILRYVVFVFAGNLPMVFLGYLLQGPSTGVFIPATVIFINEHLEMSEQTQGQTIFNVLTAGLAGCVSSFGGGLVQDHFSLKTTMLMCVCCNIIGAAFIWFSTARSRKR